MLPQNGVLRWFAQTRSPGIRRRVGALGDRNFLLAEHIRAYARLLVDQGRVEQATPLMTESHTIFQAHGDR